MFGVHERMVYARNRPSLPGAQWTGLVTQIALEMLSSGRVEAVVCVQSDPADPFKPRPVVATTPEEILKARGGHPCAPAAFCPSVKGATQGALAC